MAAKAAKSKRGRRAAARNKMMSNEIRAAALNVLVKAGPSNPAEIARTIGSTTPKVTYHVKQLERYGFAELVSEEVAAGNVRHIYRATESHMVETDEWNEVSAAMKDQLVAEWLQGQVDDLVLGARSNIGKDELFHITRDHYSVDKEGLEALLKIKEEARLAEEAAVAEAAGRIAEDGAETIRVASALTLFEIQPARD